MGIDEAFSIFQRMGDFSITISWLSWLLLVLRKLSKVKGLIAKPIIKAKTNFNPTYLAAFYRGLEDVNHF